MTDPYRGPVRGPYRGAAPTGSARRGSRDDDDALDDFLSEISGQGSWGRASVSGYTERPRHPEASGYHDSGGRHGAAGRASVGRASVGRHAATGAASVPGGAAAGRAAVGRAAVGEAPGRAQVRPEVPLGGPERPRGGGRRRPSGGDRARKRQRQRKMVAFLAVAVMLTGFLVLAGTYFVVNVPTPSQLAAKEQSSTILAADGKTELARVGTVNRKYVTIDKIPKHVQHAVVTAEDRTFYSNSGIDIKGIMRAAWNNITDDDVEGASTITQQYVRNAADLDRSVSYTRKLKEMVMAVKVNQELTKDEILEYYLNTIYFGRNAYGVEAASKAYFGKPVSKLTVEEGGLLATVIKNPSGYDPENDPEGAQERWRWVLQGMVDMKWLDPAVPAKAKFPKTRPASEAKGAQFGLSRPTGHVIKYVYDELAALGISRQDLNTRGYTIQTTIDPKMQKAAEKAAATVLKGQPKELASALVAVQPGTGRVLAYYGGKDGSGWDNAGWNPTKDGEYGGGHQPGSSFKAYALAAALEQGISIQSYWDGFSPKEFPDRENPVSNSDNNNECKRCTLQKATVLSLNTTYYGVTYQLGKEKVIDLASKAGIRVMKTNDLKPIELTGNPDAAKHFSTEVGIGQFPVTVLDNANGFATFAAGGVAATPHFVDKVIENEEVIHEIKPQTTRAFSPETAADATHVMKRIPREGGDELTDGRPVAGKTGTWQYKQTDDNAHAWMAGYTPQVSAAVWMGRSGDDGPITTKNGVRIYGSGLPSEIWKHFMSAAHSGKKVKEFPDPVYKGDAGAGDAESPEPSPTPSQEESDEPDEPEVPENPEPSRPGRPPTTDPGCTFVCNGRETYQSPDADES